MTKDESTLCGQSGTVESATEDSRANRRKRLAQQIGRLLAHTWLARRRKAVANATPNDEPPQKDCSA